ncbi:Legume lectin domain [Arabidopsis thaliana x Arabidopsis arenosa]|uniref:Legume lectin domain n=1 Tax=Arabidopsis thaliana x Arabidopsis arenosa TaxID=1240361 RepID=A0A8T2C7J0_9BRAS|nr:Legume lectin domain [Arabidopsis thaliana x Arabidopsis arenosa]
MQIQKLCFFALFISLFSSKTISAVKFNFNHFDGTDLIFLGYAELGPATDGMSRSGALSMTRDKNPFSHGQGLYTNRIPFKSSNNTSSSSVYSFKTSFTFSINPRRSNPNPGHGLAFIVVPTVNYDQDSTRGFLGLVNRTTNGNPNNHLFAVEFDVFQDKRFGDINDNHVGININSVNSKVSEKAGYWVQTRTEGKNQWLFKEVKLSNGDNYKAWIEYKNSKVTVTLAPAHLTKPKRPLIETQVDLSEVVFETMYTGFSGSMGRGIERHDIWSWSFENTAKNN